MQLEGRACSRPISQTFNEVVDHLLFVGSENADVVARIVADFIAPVVANLERHVDRFATWWKFETQEVSTEHNQSATNTQLTLDRLMPKPSWSQLDSRTPSGRECWISLNICISISVVIQTSKKSLNGPSGPLTGDQVAGHWRRHETDGVGRDGIVAQGGAGVVDVDIVLQAEGLASNVENFLCPNFEGLLLATQLVARRHLHQSLAAQFAHQIVDVLAESAKVRVRAGTQCEYGEPVIKEARWYALAINKRSPFFSQIDSSI